MWAFQLLFVIYLLKTLVYCILYSRSRSRSRYPVIAENRVSRFSVDIILPMYNEEKVVVNTIRNLLDICYPDLSVIVIDDGSLDGSHQVVIDHYGDHPRVKIMQQGNMGKSAALNRAMGASQSDIVVCIDADTLVNPNIIDKILPHFEDANVAAVSGYVKVGNQVNLLTEIQYIEYITVQNHERKLFEPINGILVVPGALGAFRRSAVIDVGGFTIDTLAEDCDISIRMLCNNYTIRNACEAISFTEAPHMPGLFLKQRVRWTVGLVQGLFKHRTLLLNHPNRALALIVIPYTWIYRIILPVMLPLLDYFFLYTFIVLGQVELLNFYLSIVLFDVLISYFILKQQKEPVNLIRLTFIRLFYKHLTLATYISIFRRWLNGNLFRWGKIPRQGNVKIE